MVEAVEEWLSSAPYASAFVVTFKSTRVRVRVPLDVTPVDRRGPPASRRRSNSLPIKSKSLTT